MRIIVLLLAGLLIFSGCGFPELKEKASAQFVDQYFKTSISLIELHKIRYGSYPVSLDSLEYMGDWDKAIYGFVKYTRLHTGYQLDVLPGPFGEKEPAMSFPADFWNGLGTTFTGAGK